MQTPEFNFLSRLLHRTALGSNWIAKASFDLEKSLHYNYTNRAIEKPVFISGLARSGSTALLNLLYATDEFRSLTYRDMPFILMPGIWKRLSTPYRKKNIKQERAHGDSLMVDFDSPEAFEEVFWRTFCGEEYILSGELITHDPGKQELAKFRQFVRNILNSDDADKPRRYLSKNNNNILRLNSLKRAFKDSIILIPFRDPLLQARSLHKQHQRFIKLQNKNMFGLRYMGYLGHHEFGLGHKTFRFSSQTIDVEPKSINYWIEIWIRAYQHLLNTDLPGLHFISHEEACSHPLQLFERLSGPLSLNFDKNLVSKLYKSSSIKPEHLPIEEKLYTKSRIIYDQLINKTKLY